MTQYKTTRRNGYGKIADVLMLSSAVPGKGLVYPSLLNSWLKMAMQSLNISKPKK